MPAPGPPDRPHNDTDFAAARERMIEQQLRRRGVTDPVVLAAMRAIPRHLFVSNELQDHAYEDEALPSQEGQTISQPYMVGIMTQELHLFAGARVLEIGAGTGYQTAILAHIVGSAGQVLSIERVPALAHAARVHLHDLGFRNVLIVVADGSLGWPASESEQHFFNRILVTAGAPRVPAPLTDQLADGGILIAPIGDADSQILTRISRAGNQLSATQLMGCRFVPLIGAHGWKAANP